MHNDFHAIAKYPDSSDLKIERARNQQRHFEHEKWDNLLMNI